MPFHCAASAKVLLAYRQPKEINSIINKKNLHKYTSKTITDPQELENHLKQIKDKGCLLYTSDAADE